MLLTDFWVAGRLGATCSQQEHTMQLHHTWHHVAHLTHVDPRISLEHVGDLLAGNSDF